MVLSEKARDFFIYRGSMEDGVPWRRSINRSAEYVPTHEKAINKAGFSSNGTRRLLIRQGFPVTVLYLENNKDVIQGTVQIYFISCHFFTFI